MSKSTPINQLPRNEEQDPETQEMVHQVLNEIQDQENQEPFGIPPQPQGPLPPQGPQGPMMPQPIQSVQGPPTNNFPQPGMPQGQPQGQEPFNSHPYDGPRVMHGPPQIPPEMFEMPPQSWTDMLLAEGKEPMLIAGLFIMLNMGQVDALIGKYVPFENPLILLGVKALVAGALFFIIKKLVIGHPHPPPFAMLPPPPPREE